MEQQRTEPEREVSRWDAEPRDGPAVLVVNARRLDEGTGLVGGWIRLDRTVTEVAAQIGQILGRGEDVRDYVVVDQLGLGMVMWDEDEVAGLLALARDHRGV